VPTDNYIAALDTSLGRSRQPGSPSSLPHYDAQKRDRLHNAPDENERAALRDNPLGLRSNRPVVAHRDSDAPAHHRTGGPRTSGRL